MAAHVGRDDDAFVAAAACGDRAACERLLADPALAVNAVDGAGKGAIHYAAANGDVLPVCLFVPLRPCTSVQAALLRLVLRRRGADVASLPASRR